jgi:(R,R)-butanediol dehydrogenase / meso-butanediol dehydrogenase / diacetyl reductase
MQALRWHGARDIRLEEVAEPAAPSPGFAVIDVAYCGICGSDLAEYRSGPSLIRIEPHPLTRKAPPLTLGHELSGRISALGPGSDLSLGARVTADACWRCGNCEACMRGDYHLCRYGGSIGLHSDGAFAAQVELPEYMLVPVPDRVSDEAAALTEPLAVGLHALDRAAAGPGDEVLVLGFGPIGAAAAVCGRALGARPTVVEVDPARQRKAAELGFRTLEAGDELPRRARRLLGGGGADVVIESTGAASALPDAVECTKRGGRIALVGLSSDPVKIDAKRLVLFERSLVGCLGYRHDLPRVVKMIEEGQIDPTELIGEVVPLADAGKVLADLASGPSEKIKVLVDPRG